MSPHRQCLYTWEWQKLRIIQNFSTPESTRQSCVNLMTYIQEAKVMDEDGELIARLTRVSNLHAATQMGLNGRIAREKSLNIRNHGDLIRIETSLGLLKKYIQGQLVCGGIKVPDEGEELERLRKAWEEEPETFKVVEKDLIKRFYFGKGFKSESSDDLETRKRNRPELWWYLELMSKARSV